MALALVKLSKGVGEDKVFFLDYISYDMAKLGVFVQGSEHNNNEWSYAKIIKVLDTQNNIGA